MIWGITLLLARFASVMALAAALTAPVLADTLRVETTIIRRVPTTPPGLMPRDDRTVSTNSRKRCIETGRIAGSIVTSERAIDISMRDGPRYRMEFSEPCPALSYYQGFYYQRSRNGLLCAGRDAILDRSGTECLIRRIRRLRK